MRSIRVPFVGPAYQTRSRNQSAQRLVNWYLEVTEQGGKTQQAMYPTPGYELYQTVGVGPIRGAIEVSGSSGYVVSGTEVYRVEQGAASLAGTIQTNSGVPGLAYNGDQVLVVDGVAGYVVDVAGNTLTRITDPDYPVGVTWAQYLDKYFIVGGDGSGRFYISDLGDGSSWVGTEYASAEGDPDPLIAGVVEKRQLFLFGTNSFEIWVNTGNETFPIERIGQAFGETGCAAVATLCKMDNTIFWLGRDDRGDGMVYRMNGYDPVRVSTHALEWAIQNYARIDDARAYSIQMSGHAWYVLHFPSADATWAYDAASEAWHEWLSYDEKVGEFHQHRGICHLILGRDHIIGDRKNGNLYRLDPNVYTDNGHTIKRVRATYADDSNLNRVFYASLQIDIQAGVGLIDGQGSDPKMMLRWSDDGGHSWSNYRTATMGRIGEYGARCKWNRLGSARARVWEISVTDPVNAVVIGAVLLGEAGTS